MVERQAYLFLLNFSLHSIKVLFIRNAVVSFGRFGFGLKTYWQKV